MADGAPQDVVDAPQDVVDAGPLHEGQDLPAPPPIHDPTVPLPENRAREEGFVRDGERQRRDKRNVVHFPGLAGAPIAQPAPGTYDQHAARLPPHDPSNEWAPFSNKLEWEIARWAKLRGPTSTAFTELLQIEGVQDRLGLSFKSSKDLNKIIDSSLPEVPEFTTEEIEIDGQTYEVFLRDALQCIKLLYGNPEFLPHMSFAPERHYADEDLTIPLYHQMHSGRWWWKVQKVLEELNPGATVLPLIISTDKTLITQFRNHSAYPVYLTLGNIAKEIRRQPSKHAQILVGYLPTTRLLHIKNQEARTRATANLFHACMRRIIGALSDQSRDGIPMASGDGVFRRCHPIFAAFVGDYPEQALVACVKSGQCPKCEVDPDDLGVFEDSAPRDLASTLRALRTVDRGPELFFAECEEARIKPVDHPFWEDLSFSNVFTAITPDILHQMYQGMVKHTVEWLHKAFGAAEMDERCKRLPRNHGARLFSSGISHLSRVSGQEHKDMCRILMALIVDLELPDGSSPARVVRAVRALLDFLYLAQYPSHSENTLGYLEEALQRFHDNKDVFEELGIREHFNIPKLHGLSHYVASIKLFGTTDNYNTEATERLHIDYAKDAYRSTNHKDAFHQMTRWLVRREQIWQHERYISWPAAAAPAAAPPAARDNDPHERIHMTRLPSAKSVSFTQLGAAYGAVDFEKALAQYIVLERNSGLSERQASNVAEGIKLPFRSVATYHKIKLSIPDAQDNEDLPDARDAVHIRPGHFDTRDRRVPGRFDTVLVNTGDGQNARVLGYRVAQVRVVFSLAAKAHAAAFPAQYRGPEHLAYIEWFTPFAAAAEPDHLMYKISRAYRGGARRRAFAVIPVEQIQRSVHLFPVFGRIAPRDWTSGNVLERCEKFYVSSFLDRHTYITVY
ncbi:hypothetical protein FA95DRAFT_1549668 [Auriscalpium vulgare]|uniref:Uncharacterized protein n=1 Tax=Auriscalpium vulgare TaxID=40419 RepID=A0ACB8R9E3_9AGAM|nr:hypothetical protein FA95DRAFT_1549668 [Auriscalpium vulgare]